MDVFSPSPPPPPTRQYHYSRGLRPTLEFFLDFLFAVLFNFCLAEPVVVASPGCGGAATPNLPSLG